MYATPNSGLRKGHEARKVAAEARQAAANASAIRRVAKKGSEK
jgi:hypothetical protein